MPRFIPGRPTIIVQNMPGAGDVLATNFMYTIAPKDGTTVATLHNAMPVHQVLGGQGVRFDAGKFEWLGSTGSENEVILVWHTTGIRAIAEVTKREVILGGTGAGSGIVIIPRLMNALLGTKFKIVTGYKSSEDINLALQRGEVEARAFSLSAIKAQRADWLRDKRITILAQVGAKRAHEIQDVPLVTELAKSEENRQVFKLISAAPGLGRPFVAPPGVPADRLAILRKAFAATMEDQAFLAEAEKLQLDIDAISAEEVTQLVRETVNAPASVVAKAKAAIESAGER
jgi:tripartite-type tricarboxylate transporter receptor subunit TctC